MRKYLYRQTMKESFSANVKKLNSKIISFMGKKKRRLDIFVQKVKKTKLSVHVSLYYFILRILQKSIFD